MTAVLRNTLYKHSCISGKHFLAGGQLLPCRYLAQRLRNTMVHCGVQVWRVDSRRPLGIGDAAALNGRQQVTTAVTIGFTMH